MPKLTIITGDYLNFINSNSHEELKEAFSIATSQTQTGREAIQEGIDRVKHLVEDTNVFTNDEAFWLGIRIGVIKSTTPVEVEIVFFEENGVVKTTSLDKYGNPSIWYDGMFDCTAYNTGKIIQMQTAKRNSERIAARPLQFSLDELGKLEPITRGGSEAVIESVDAEHIFGFVEMPDGNAVNVIWDHLGLNIQREFYGYDLFLKPKKA